MELTINEIIKDLRSDYKIDNVKATQEKFAEKLGIPQSTYETYEKDGTSVPIDTIIKIAKLCNVSTDYILGLSEIKTPLNTDINNLHLSNDAIKVLREKKYNPVLFSELITHEKFIYFMLDLEIYINSYVDEGLQYYNTYMDAARFALTLGLKEKTEEEIEEHLREINAIHMAQEDYFATTFAKDIMPIAEDLKEKHKDSSSTSDPKRLRFTDYIKTFLYFIKKNKKGKDDYLTLKNAIVNVADMALEDNGIDKNIAKATLESTNKVLDNGLLNSPILEPNARKRRDNKNKRKRKEQIK